MSQQANKTKVVVFIVLGLLLGLAMVLAFGGSQMVSKQEKFLMFFEGSVNGLTIGSPVKFKGVPIGTVSALRLRELRQGSEQRVAVLVQVDVENMQRTLGVEADLADPAVLDRLVRGGLRGKLEVLSYPAGTMYVDLNYYNDAPPPPPVTGELEAAVIPTVRSNAGDLIRKIQSLATFMRTYDIKGLAARINGILDSATTKVENLDLGGFNRGTLRALGGLERFTRGNWARGMHDFSSDLAGYRDTFTTYDRVVAEQGAGMIGLSRGAHEKISAFDAELKKIHAQVESDGELRKSVMSAIEKYTELARTIRVQAEQWEQSPSYFSPRPDTASSRRGGPPAPPAPAPEAH